MSRRTLIAVLVAALGLAGFVGPGTGAAAAAVKQPNIVFVLTDDLSWNLVKHMPHVRAMQRKGTTFSRYVVSNSLCCPSRASMFTGQFPHNTGVLSNEAPNGGFTMFQSLGDEAHTWGTALQGNGYETGMMGKYLNGYQPRFAAGATTGYVPPGWTDWDVAGNGYPEFGYALNINGTVVRYGRRPENYLTDVMAARGTAFIDRSVAAGTPFALELSTFAPHKPYTPASRDVHTFGGLKAPRTKAFDADTTNAPGWLAHRTKLTGAQIASIDADFRNRVRSVQAIDRMIGEVEDTLRTHGIADDTYIVFGSDNGYHMGEHRLLPGKQTPFDTDVRVPLIVTGPKVKAGRTVAKLTSNVDLAPTFADLSHTPVAKSTMDGQSLVRFLRGRRVAHWRLGTLIEHRGSDEDPADPDAQIPAAGVPPTYAALRTATSLYVEYAGSGTRQYHDLISDPEELDNTYGRLPTARRNRLHRMLLALERCKGQGSCFKAARTP